MKSNKDTILDLGKEVVDAHRKYVDAYLDALEHLYDVKWTLSKENQERLQGAIDKVKEANRAVSEIANSSINMVSIACK